MAATCKPIKSTRTGPINKMQVTPENNYTDSRMTTFSHSHTVSPDQCGSTVTQTVDAPLSVVWSVVRRFENPQAYKLFVRSCELISGDGGTGSVRELTVVTGMPAERSTERLDRLDDDSNVMVISIVGGDHKLVNYRSTTSLHEDKGGRTVVVESYVVDIPADSCEKDTCLFADTIIGCNLKSLARIAERMVVCGVGDSLRT